MTEQEPIKRISHCQQCKGTFSCESMVARQEDGSYSHDNTRRFQFIYLDGAINDRIIVPEAIEDCEIRKQNVKPNKNESTKIKNKTINNLPKLPKLPKEITERPMVAKKEKIKTRVIYNSNETIVENKVIRIKTKKHKRRYNPNLVKKDHSFYYSRVAR